MDTIAGQIMEAKRVLRAIYYTAVKDMAENCKQEIESGRIDSNDGLHDWIMDTVGGSEWVIDSPHASLCLFISDNEDRYFDDGMPPESVVSSEGIDSATLAHHAMRADLYETLETIGIPSSWEPAEEEEEEEEEEPPTPEECQKVMTTLGSDTLTPETIIEKAPLAWDRAASILLLLESEGKIRRVHDDKWQAILPEPITPEGTTDHA